MVAKSGVHSYGSGSGWPALVFPIVGMVTDSLETSLQKVVWSVDVEAVEGRVSSALSDGVYIGPGHRATCNLPNPSLITSTRDFDISDPSSLKTHNKDIRRTW